jgi:hypothetical protein
MGTEVTKERCGDKQEIMVKHKVWQKYNTINKRNLVDLLHLVANTGNLNQN